MQINNLILSTFRRGGSRRACKTGVVRAIALFLFFAVGPVWATPVGSVIDVSGNALLLRKDNQRPIALFDNLFVDDRLQLSSGARLVLTHNATRSEYSFSAPADVEVTTAGVKLHSGAQPKAKPLSELAALSVAAGSSRNVVGAVQMRGVSQPPTTPSNGDTVLLTTPELSWPAVNASGEFSLILKNADGETLLETRTTQTALRIDAARPLAWGATYDWTLSGRHGERPFSLFRTFKVIAAEDRAALARLEPAANGEFSAWVTYARALEHLGAWGAARSVWTRLAAQRPDLPTLDALAKGKPLPVSSE